MSLDPVRPVRAVAQALAILLAAYVLALALLIVLVPAADYFGHEPGATSTDTCKRPGTSCQRPASEPGADR
jgi:hypothetical protein